MCDYPQEEITEMSQFYGGKRCIILGTTDDVQWAHVLDTALPSNERLSMMLDRNLREDRHPQHAAEVRENLVPVYIGHHACMDRVPPRSTLFLHEDVLARTLAYERELQKWRIEELEAGRPDPGRPMYHEVFGGTRITTHRYHCSGTLPSFLLARNEGDDMNEQLHTYTNVDCPGIDNAASTRNFPVIDTLLSIPFSVLHNLPRLCGIFPLSGYQQRLIVIGSEIIMLWSWDPSASLIKQMGAIRKRNCALKQQNDTRNPKPHPIHHPSRKDTGFSNISLHTSRSATLTPNHNPNQIKRVVEQGPIFLGQPTQPTHLIVTDEMLVMDGPLFAGMDEELMKEDESHVEGGIAGITGSQVTSEGGTEDSDDTDDVQAVEDKSTVCPASLFITSWYQSVISSKLESPSLVPTPFERGVIGGMSVNDVLMVKGLIRPLVYLKFMDLTSFSLC